MRRRSVTRRDPRQVAGDLAIEHEGVQAVSAPDVAANIPGEVSGDRGQVDRGVATGSGARATAAAGDIVVPKDQLIGVGQPDPVGSGCPTPINWSFGTTMSPAAAVARAPEPVATPRSTCPRSPLTSPGIFAATSGAETAWTPSCSMARSPAT